MHELGIAQGILSVVLDIAGERQVSSVVVRIGEEQCIVHDSLAFGFGLLAEGTSCSQAQLRCVTVAGAVVLVDEVGLAGDPPTTLRRPGAEVVEAPHDHPHDHDHDAAEALVEPAHTHRGI